ncbi:MAG TPA: radical SAM protein, partial [Thermoanaerobaculia bacterium]|nr:radical SAM protein [Thermoanaerobaculia bacterium]
MSFAEVIARTWRDNHLFSVLLELTYRCNLDCFFCYNDLGLKGEPLSREQYFRFFDELRDLEVLHLALSGGEPLAHPDFLALGARARELGFVVRIKSNGHALRGELARRIRDEIDPFVIEVSLHGATAATHDRQTRVPGSFERLLANLAELQALGLRVKLNSTLTAWNEGEIEAMFGLADAVGLRLQVDSEVTPRDDGGREPLQVTPSREGVLRLFRLQTERGRALAAEPAAAAAVRSVDEGVPVPVGKHCGAGSSG